MVCPVLLTFHLWDSENDSCSCYQLEIVQHSFHDLTHRSGCSVASSRFQRTSRKVGQEKKRLERNLTNHYSMPLLLIQDTKQVYYTFSKSSKFSPMIPKLNTKKKKYYFLYHHSFHSNVRSASKSDNQPGTFTCKCTQCKTCPFISNTVKISGPNLRTQSQDPIFTCISLNVIYCITCTLCKKIYIGEAGRKLANRFRRHLQDVEKNDTDAFKPVARDFNPPNYSHHNMTICGLSLHHGNTESRKNLEQKFIFQLGTPSPHRINECLSFL